MKRHPLLMAVPVVAALAAAVVLVVWQARAVVVDLDPRLPQIHGRSVADDPGAVPRNQGTLITGTGAPADLDGSWPQFRGPDRDAKAVYDDPLLIDWPPDGPPVLWRIPVGEGYAGAAVHAGRVYLVDYDHQKQEDAVRCLSLDDGAEIWRHTYWVKIKRFHGMSRTVPAVSDRYVVSVGPKCHVRCLKADTGELLWKIDMVRRFGTVVPQWYTGQCPLIDRGRAILAPGGDPLMMAVDLASGDVLWRTPNPGGWEMTHSSVMIAEIGGRRQYVYCTTRGVVGVSADDGRLLWTWPEWRIANATSPSPVVIGDGRIFFTGDYGAGGQMVRVSEQDGAFTVTELFRTTPRVFSCKQHTPVPVDGHLVTVLPDGRVVRADLDGKPLWTSPSSVNTGWGPFMFINDLLYVLNDDTGELVVADAGPAGYRERARAKVLTGHEAWAPMAFADGRLILRDLTEMVCLDLRARPGGPAEVSADD